MVDFSVFGNPKVLPKSYTSAAKWTPFFVTPFSIVLMGYYASYNIDPLFMFTFPSLFRMYNQFTKCPSCSSIRMLIFQSYLLCGSFSFTPMYHQWIVPFAILFALMLSLISFHLFL